MSSYEPYNAEEVEAILEEREAYESYMESEWMEERDREDDCVYQMMMSETDES